MSPIGFCNIHLTDFTSSYNRKEKFAALSAKIGVADFHLRFAVTGKLKPKLDSQKQTHD